MRARLAVFWAVMGLVGPMGRMEAVTITNHLDNGWAQHSLAVNVGDTILWVNEQAPTLPANYVESYGGEWNSPLLQVGDSFSFTFTKPGFYAYRTGVAYPPHAAGTVTVLPWTGAPPAFKIICPVEGSLLAGAEYVVQASATNAEVITNVEYYANSLLIGAGTNLPYSITWPVLPQGPYVLLAKATDRLGGITWSQPVNVAVGPDLWAWGPRLLPTGELLIHYNSFPFDISVYFESSDTAEFTAHSALFQAYVAGVYVDESVRGGAVAARFYRIWP